MEKDVQEIPAVNDRRLSYYEINAQDPMNPRLGAGSPQEVLNLPDDGTNIRFFMLDPLDAIPWRARWYKGDMDESGKITTYPQAHTSQAEGAWAGFFLPLLPRMAKIAKNILAGQFQKERSHDGPMWVRVRPAGLAVAIIPGPPKLESLLEDQPESRWWPVYVRLLGDPTALSDLLEAIGRLEIDAYDEKGPDE
jgi:hypothetical protein